MDPAAIYTTGFYERIEPSSRQSAAVIVPALVRWLRPASVVDVGCGSGAWLAEFERAGVKDFLGVDGPWASETILKIPRDRLFLHDLSVPLAPPRRFDLAVSLEVAEHLPQSVADVFIESLVALAPIVLFSAAVPGQGGDGHLNEQPHEWWDKLFETHGYRAVRDLKHLRLDDPQVAWWYARNLVVYAHESAALPSHLNPHDANGTAVKVSRQDLAVVLMTCAQSQPYLEQFVDSWEEWIGSGLGQPILSVDLTASTRLLGDYLRLLQRLDPSAVHVHSKPTGMSVMESINDAAFFALESALGEIGDRRFLLFLEDDIVFSSRFLEHLDLLELQSDAGFYTLYQPGGGYPASPIEPYRFYGTQCLLLPHGVIPVLLEGRQEMECRFSPNYDLRWAQYLGACGYRLYSAPASYVQHIGQKSRMKQNFHSSHRFVP